MRLGLSLRDCLKVELESFSSPYLVTLTVDQSLFVGPEDALRWVQTGGVISEFVRRLRKFGVLLDKRYASFLEFQANGWPHWHLVFDASFIEFSDLCEAWAAAGWSGREGLARWGLRPAFGGKGQRPVFGGVNFRLRGRESLGAMCHYLTKYVTKQPVGGWPSWLLASTGQLRRWSVSRDFWRASPPPRPERRVTEFSKLRDKFYDPDENWVEDDDFLRKIGRVKSTIGQRCASCGDKSIVLEEVAIFDASEVGGQRWKWRYVGMIAADVWREPQLALPTFKRFDEVTKTSFVIVEADGQASLLRSLCGAGSLLGDYAEPRGSA
jgi:hypothetical protein